jgi:hypothetical protein
MKKLLAIGLLIVSGSLVGQEGIPPGTILPVQLTSSIRLDKARRGEEITARVMQDVPLPDGSATHAGAKVIGHIVFAQPNDRDGARVILRFDTLVANGRKIPIVTNVRALASMTEVEEAQVPATGPDRGTSEFDWNTAQIGGEVNYHGTIVANGLTAVGRSVPPQGTLAKVSSSPGCRGSLGGAGQMQALWVFSSTACGIYGYPNLTLVHAGRSEPIGEIVLVLKTGKMNIRSGSGILLRVNESGPQK